MDIMKLHELGGDQILEELERRGDRYVDMKKEASTSEFLLKRRYAAVYTSIRSTKGCSVEDAKNMALNDPDYLQAFREDVKCQLKKDAAQLALERARIAVELWRYHRADMRKV